MGLAEPERRERLEHLPDPVDVGRRVAPRQRRRTPPGLDLALGRERPHGPTHLVGLGEGDPGRLGDDEQHLLVEDDDSLGLAQRGDERRVKELRLLPPLAGIEERDDHVGLDRTGAEERDVDDEVLEPLRAELADELALARALDLEAAEGVRGPDQPERRLVVERHLLTVVEVDAHLLDPADLVDGMGHRGLHPDAEDVELEQPERLDVVLVELTHRKADPARLDRGAVEQPGVGQDHPARVEGDVSGQSVEPLDEVEHEVEPRSVEPAGPQLGQVGDGVADVAGRDVRERLRHGVDLGRRHPQGSPDVTDRVPDPVAVHHRDAGDPLTPESGEDLLVDLGAPGRLDVDVDVGQLGPQR